MGKRRVEINIISAEGLKLSPSFGKPHTYAVVWIHPSKKFYTHVDQEGAKSPVWNQKLVISADTYSLEQGSGKFTIEIFHRGHIHDKPIGTVEVPFKELPHEARFNRETPSEIQYMAFEIRRPSGRMKGVLNLSIRLREVSPHCSSSSSSSSSCSSEPSSPRNSGKLPPPPPPPPPQDPVYPPSYPPPPPRDPVYPPSYPPPGYPSYGAPSSYDRDYHQPQSYGYGGNFQQQPPLGYGNLGPGYGQTQPNYYAPPPPPPAAKSGHSNLALGAGIAAGALGGLVLGEVVEDIAENADDDDDFE